MRLGSRVAMVVLLVASLSTAHAAGDDLRTVGEKSGYVDTGRYEEVQRLCPAFAARFPRTARCLDFGRTPEGRPMLALVASADGTLDPEAVRRAERPVILVLGGIHAGEIDGKDAGFALLRALLEGQGPARALGAATLVFVPVYNPDGHERFGPHQRPNQRGPRQGGFRTTAQNLNLNRDFVKAEAPETRSLLALWAAWDPALLVDLHVTDGAKFEHDVAVLVAPEEPVPGGLEETAHALSDAIIERTRGRGHLPLPFYPSFRKDDDPTSGIDAAPGPARFSQRYAAARNRLGILVETHSWRDYAYRVRTTRDVLEAILEEAAAHAATWRKTELEADRAGAELGGHDVALAWKTVPPGRSIEFRGYAYTREKSEISGATWTRYDERHPQIWKMELFDHVAPAKSARAPAAGYLVPAAQAALVAAKLDAHGLRFQRLERAVERAPTSTFRAETVSYAAVPFEGRFVTTLTGAWKAEPRSVPAGSLFVPIAQARAALLMQLLEPTAPDSLASWGFFDAAFEVKEYMEDYVAEETARQMLARDPKLRARFDAALARDPAMAADPRKRLRFFYERHPSWDERVNLYPVYHLDAPLPH
jgi:hypothetical protein